MIHITAMIHELAHVDRETVSVGRLTKVWQFASVIRNAKIGEECRIASTSIVDGATIGDRCIISHGAFLDPGIRIEDDVFIGPHVALCNDAWPRTDKTGFDMPALISGDFVTTFIMKGASLGANVVVMPGIMIGQNAMIAAGSVVTRDVPHDFLWKRDGTTVRIDPETPARRMRRAIF